MVPPTRDESNEADPRPPAGAPPAAPATRSFLKDFQNLLIIERESGVCVFEGMFREDELGVDADLMGGFLVAMLQFANELQEDTIQAIRLRKRQIVYDVSKNLIVTAAVRPGVDADAIQDTLRRIRKDFKHRYKHQLSAWDGNVEQFDAFGDQLRDLGIEAATTGTNTDAAEPERRWHGRKLLNKEVLRSFLSARVDTLRKIGARGKETLHGVKDVVETAKDAFTKATKHGKSLLGNIRSIFRRSSGDDEKDAE